MSLSEPFDLLSDFPGWVTTFEPKWRQERSTLANGRIIVKDFGSPLWQLTAQSIPLNVNELDYWRARLDAMENGLTTFYGYSLSRTYPIRYPRGSWPTGVSFSGTTAVLASVNANRKAVTVSHLPAGYVVSVGDYIQIGDTDLHRVMETSTADGSGLTSEFEVRPHIWTGVSSGAVSVKKPHCIMAIVPDSITSPSDLDGFGSVSFQAIEARA